MVEEYIHIKKNAFSFLARREHSVNELKTKLLHKGYDETIVEEVLNDLIKERNLSDERYVEMMFRYHFGRGQGPRKITNLIQQAQVNSSLIQQAYNDFEGDWHQSAAKERQKRFGDWTGDLKDKIKQTRFLSARGFEFEQIESSFYKDKY